MTTKDTQTDVLSTFSMGRDLSCDRMVRTLKAKSTSFGKPDVRDLIRRSYFSTAISTTGVGVGMVTDVREEAAGWVEWYIATELPSWSRAAPDVEAGP